MDRLKKIILLCLALGLCFSCNRKTVPNSYTHYERLYQDYDEATTDEGNLQEGSRYKAEPATIRAARRATISKYGYAPRPNEDISRMVIQRAEYALGTPYVFGGTKLGGFDCSGLVRWAYKGAGIHLPRTAAEQMTVGYKIRDISQMRAGDIVAFRRRGGYHTGIYLGDGLFIHAPRTHKRVRVESLETGYFHHNFLGARRVAVQGNGPGSFTAEARRALNGEEAVQTSLDKQNATSYTEGEPTALSEREEHSYSKKSKGRSRDDSRYSKKHRDHDRSAKKGKYRGRDHDSDRYSKNRRGSEEQHLSKKNRDKLKKGDGSKSKMSQAGKKKVDKKKIVVKPLGKKKKKK